MSCRGQRIGAYFGEAADAACGHCDNCASGSAAQVASISAARARRRHRRDTPPLVALTAPQLGDRVIHRRFGAGVVTAIDGRA